MPPELGFRLFNEKRAESVPDRLERAAHTDSLYRRQVFVAEYSMGNAASG
jgi:hypothetical protein